MQQKIGERYRWGATPLSLAKMQGQGSAVKNWRGLPLNFGKNAGARQCSKKWRALPLGGYPSIFGKNAGAGQCSKKLERAFGKIAGAGSAAVGLPHYLWEKCRGRAVQQKLASAAGGLPLYLAGVGQCSKNLASATAGGRIFGNNMGALIPTKTP